MVHAPVRPLVAGTVASGRQSRFAAGGAAVGGAGQMYRAIAAQMASSLQQEVGVVGDAVQRCRHVQQEGGAVAGGLPHGVCQTILKISKIEKKR